MLFIKKIRPDYYLKKFIDYCKDKYKDNLFAIVIYGSYAWGYFDKKSSDYDVFIIFKNGTPKNKKLAQKEFNKLFPKISLQYYCTAEELINKVREGHWSIYITLLKSAKVGLNLKFSTETCFQRDLTRFFVGVKYNNGKIVTKNSCFNIFSSIEF